MYFYTLENHIKVLREEELYHQRIQKVVMQARPHGVMVSTLDSESSDPSSSLGGTCQCFVSLFSPGKYCLPIDKISLACFISCKSAFG